MSERVSERAPVLPQTAIPDSSADFLAEQINVLFQQACILDVNAIKPGNVGLHAPGHNMCARDFMLSAAACGKAICRRGQSLGQRILNAVKATREAVSCNTNLGIILLCAPVIQALTEHVRGRYLRDRIENVLEYADVIDTRDVFTAIRLAHPGGMGEVADADIRQTPKMGLKAVMDFARERDLIALQYVTGYRLVYEKIMPAFLELRTQYGYDCWAITGAYLTVLDSYSDSLIARKYGTAVSVETSKRFRPLLKELDDCDKRRESFQSFEHSLLELDGDLKRDGINPGTTADLVIASAFIASLERALHEKFA